MHLAHPAQLLERLVDVPHAQALASVVRHPPFSLPFHLLLWRQVLIVVVAMVTNGRDEQESGESVVGERRRGRQAGT